MDREDDVAYFERRLGEATQSADAATDVAVRARYEELAGLYRDRLNRLRSDAGDDRPTGWVVD